MRKLDGAQKSTQVTVSLTDRLVQMVDILLNEDGLGFSRSEVIRRAVEEFFYMKRPRYMFERSATDITKRAKIKEEKDFETMDDMEYAKSIKGPILYNRDNKPHLIIATLGNGIRGVPVKGLKDWVGNEMFDVGIAMHKELIKQGVDFRDRIDSSRITLDREFNIDVDTYLNAQPNEQNDNTDS